MDSQKRFNYKKIIFLFIAAIFISLFLYSIKAHALEFETNIPTRITLYKEPVDVFILIKNTSSTGNLYNLKSYTSPFVSRIDPQAIRLDGGQEKQVKLTIYPIANTTNQEYTSTLEISENQVIHFFAITVIQLTNRVCDVDINHTIDYLSDSNKYHLDLGLTNNGVRYQTINLNKFEDLNSDDYKEMDVGLFPNETKHINYYIDTNKPSIELSYVCNSLFQTKKIDIPSKPNTYESNKVKGVSGLFTFTNFGTNIKNIFNSLTFQIILIIIIILLAITFASRYIRLIHLHNLRRRM